MSSPIKYCPICFEPIYVKNHTFCNEHFHAYEKNQITQCPNHDINIYYDKKLGCKYCAGEYKLHKCLVCNEYTGHPNHLLCIRHFKIERKKAKIFALPIHYNDKDKHFYITIEDDEYHYNIPFKIKEPKNQNDVGIITNNELIRRMHISDVPYKPVFIVIYFNCKGIDFFQYTVLPKPKNLQKILNYAIATKVIIDKSKANPLILSYINGTETAI